jgi:hypothetical protein
MAEVMTGGRVGEREGPVQKTTLPHDRQQKALTSKNASCHGARAGPSSGRLSCAAYARVV